MEIGYKKNKIKKQLSDISSIKKYFGVNAKKVVSRLDDIEASPNLAILKQLPAANCHRLKGKREGQWAVDVSKNFRLIFEISEEFLFVNDNSFAELKNVKEIVIVEIVDYH